MYKFSTRTKKLESSSILEIAAKANYLRSQGIDVVSLAAGEPDFNTPESIQIAANKAIRDGITKYTPSAGFLALREAIASKVSLENSFLVKPEEVVITAGAKHALYLALQCLVEEGDMVLIPTPAWVSYGPMIETTGASFHPLPLYAEDGYQPNVERWKNIPIPSSAKGIIVNTPNNPTGVTYSKESLHELVNWALQRNLWILSDEIYEKILYDGVKHYSCASFGPEAKDMVITVSGFSKSYCMTGWRLGWAIGNRELIEKMTALQSQSNSHVTSFVQMAGIAALQLPELEIKKMVQEFDRRRRFCIEKLELLSNQNILQYTTPTGAFYFFLDLSKILVRHEVSDVDFCKKLLTKYLVGTVPGSYFGQAHSMRISYATSLQNLEKAFARLQEFLQKEKF